MLHDATRMLCAIQAGSNLDPRLSHSSGWKGYDPQLVMGLYPTEVATDYAFVGFGGGYHISHDTISG